MLKRGMVIEFDLNSENPLGFFASLRALDFLFIIVLLIFALIILKLSL